jgi:hypothetical protein
VAGAGARSRVARQARSGPVAARRIALRARLQRGRAGRGDGDPGRPPATRYPSEAAPRRPATQPAARSSRSGGREQERASRGEPGAPPHNRAPASEPRPRTRAPRPGGPRTSAAGQQVLLRVAHQAEAGQGDQEVVEGRVPAEARHDEEGREPPTGRAPDRPAAMPRARERQRGDPEVEDLEERAPALEQDLSPGPTVVRASPESRRGTARSASDAGCSDQYPAPAPAPWTARDPDSACPSVGSHWTHPRATATARATADHPATCASRARPGRVRATCQASPAAPATPVPRHRSPEPAS